MNVIAHQIVETLLEGEDEKEKTKKMPDWLKKIKGIKDEPEEGGDDKADKGASKEPKESKGGGGGGGSAKSSDTTVGKTW